MRYHIGICSRCYGETYRKEKAHWKHDVMWWCDHARPEQCIARLREAMRLPIPVGRTYPGAELKPHE